MSVFSLHEHTGGTQQNHFVRNEKREFLSIKIYYILARVHHGVMNEVITPLLRMTISGYGGLSLLIFLCSASHCSCHAAKCAQILCSEESLR